MSSIQNIKPTPDMLAALLMKRFGPADLPPDTLSVIQAAFFADILYLMTRGRELVEDRLVRTAYTPMHSTFSSSHASSERLWDDIWFENDYSREYLASAFSKEDRAFVNSIGRVVFEGGGDAGKARGHILKIKCVREAALGRIISKQRVIDDLHGDDAVSRLASTLRLDKKVVD